MILVCIFDVNILQMRRNIFPLLAVIFIFSGCSTSTSDQDCTSDECIKKQAYDNVIAVHDEVMPKMSYISELKGQIEQRMNETDDSLVIAPWQELMVNLDVADEVMWVWMRQFNSDLEEIDIDEAMAYLKAEQEKIDEVARKINEAIAEAEQKLAN
jgi:hypothetical protein